MQVQNIECQIAQAQIGSFLAGSGLSDEAMRQLEEHIAACGDCKQALNAKRAELKAMLKPERAAVDFAAIHQEATEMQAKSIASALRKRSLQKLADPEPETISTPEPTVPAPVPAATAVVEVENPKPQKKTSTSSYWKPLIYSLGLAGVLVGMSLFSNNLAAIFGPRADSKVAIAPSSTEQPKSDVGSTASTPSNPTATTSVSTSPVVDKPVAPAEKVESNPSAAVEKSEQPSEQISNVGSEIGVNAASLASTQFESTAQPKVEAKAPVVQKPAAPVQKPSLNRQAAGRVRATPRRVNRNRRIVRRPAAAKPARSRGIKVYQP